MSCQARPVRTRRQGAHGGRLGGHTAPEGALLGTAEADLGLEPEGDGGSLHLAHHHTLLSLAVSLKALQA